MIPVADFKKEVLNWAEETKVKPKEIHVREMKSKWASCSSRGRLTFSFELLNQPSEVRDKVIVHELLHLRYGNHNKMFKALVQAYLAKKKRIDFKSF
jgi:hypothetical protein